MKLRIAWGAVSCAVDAVLLLGIWSMCGRSTSFGSLDFDNYWNQLYVPILLVSFCCLFAANGRYTDRGRCSTETAQVVVGVALVALVASFKFETPPSPSLWVTILVTLVASRVVLKWPLFRLGWARLPVLTVGPAARCAAARSAMDEDWYRGFEIREQIDCDEIGLPASAAQLMILAAQGGIRQVPIVGDNLTPDLVELQGLARDRGLTVSLILSSVTYADEWSWTGSSTMI